jgi:hypothetical protein
MSSSARRIFDDCSTPKSFFLECSTPDYTTALQNARNCLFKNTVLHFAFSDFRHITGAVF